VGHLIEIAATFGLQHWGLLVGKVISLARLQREAAEVALINTTPREEPLLAMVEEMED
jgi:hypothetical protein